MKRWLMVVTLAAMPGAVAQAATILPALSVSGGTVQHNGVFSLGWEFLLDGPTRVTALGFFDGGSPGFTEAHEVTIYSCQSQACATGAAVVSAIVPQTGGTLVDGFWYQTVEIPVLQGGYYVITGLNHTEQYFYNGTYATAPGVHYIENRFDYDLQSLGLFPTRVAPVDGGFAGPNFQFDAVPEPAGILLIPGGVGLLALLRKRRTSLHAEKTDN